MPQKCGLLEIFHASDCQRPGHTTLAPTATLLLICVHIYMQPYIYTHEWIRMCIGVCAHINVYAFAFVCMCVRTRSLSSNRTYVCECVHMCACALMYRCSHTHQYTDRRKIMSTGHTSLLPPLIRPIYNPHVVNLLSFTWTISCSPRDIFQLYFLFPKRYISCSPRDIFPVPQEIYSSYIYINS